MLNRKFLYVKLLALIPLAVIQMQGLGDGPGGDQGPALRYMGLQQAKGVERSNEAMMKITASIDSNTKSMDSLITAIGRKGLS